LTELRHKQLKFWKLHYSALELHKACL
jgi:hypothetical protein